VTTPLEQFRAERDASPVHGRSPGGWVEVRRDALGEISVSIRDGALRELTHDRLTAEIRGALAAAVADYAQISHRLFQRWAGTW
jgi:hypothetical protein